jgi:hypothetical protein
MLQRLMPDEQEAIMRFVGTRDPEPPNICTGRGARLRIRRLLETVR